MSSNSDSMTFEEKVVQRLKSDTLFQFLDEDALLKLTERAVKEALFQERRDPKYSGYGTPNMLKSPVMAAASEIAQKAAQSVMDKLTEELLADPKTKLLMQEALVAALPVAVLENMSRKFMDIAATASADANARMIQHLRERGFSNI